MWYIDGLDQGGSVDMEESIEARERSGARDAQHQWW